MAGAFGGEKANDNEIGEARVRSASQPMSGAIVTSGIVTGDDMLITRDAITGDWMLRIMKARWYSSPCRGRPPLMRSDAPPPSTPQASRSASIRAEPLRSRLVFAADLLRE